MPEMRTLKVDNVNYDVKDATARGDITTLRQRTEGLETDVNQLKTNTSDIATIRENVNNLTTNTADLPQIRQNIETNKNDITALKTTIRSPANLTVLFASEIADYSSPWEWIKNRIQTDNLSDLHVGDYIPVTCTNGVSFNARIAGVNTYKGYGDTAIGNHIDFISSSLWPTIFKMNLANFNNGIDADNPCPWLSSNGFHFINSLSGNVPNGTGNIPDTEAVDYTTGGIYYFLPDALKSVIVEKRILLPKRFSTSAIQTNDNGWSWENGGNLWLPSEFEITGAPIWGNAGYGAGGYVQYPLFTHNMNRMIDRATWWTLSSTAGSSAGFVRVYYDGLVGYSYANNSLRGPVCFRVA